MDYYFCYIDFVIVYVLLLGNVSVDAIHTVQKKVFSVLGQVQSQWILTRINPEAGPPRQTIPWSWTTASIPKPFLKICQL